MLCIVQSQLATDLNCTPGDLSGEKDSFIFTEARDNPGRRPFPRSEQHFEMLSMGKSIVVSASLDILDTVKPLLYGKDRDEAFSMPFVYGHTFFDNAFIELLMVEEKYRHCGIGSALLNYMFAECKTQKLFTSTNKSNEPMRKLLVKAGLTFCGEIDALDEGDPEMFFFRKVAK
jgi:ribosomal protein S18 acetylase RimI-like enzyme